MANPTTAPETVLADLIDAANVSIGGTAAAKGTNVWDGPERPPKTGLIPEASIFCCPYGGPRPLPYLGTGDSFRQLMVQVLVRGVVGKFREARDTAYAAHAAVHIPTLSDGLKSEGYIAAYASQEPVYLGVRDDERPRFSFNVRLTFKG